MPKKFSNSKKTKRIENTELNYIKDTNIGTRCKFNFSFLNEADDAGQSLTDWNESSDSHSLLSLNKKLVDYSQFPLTHWQKERVGRTGLTVLAIYGDFPKNSKFSEPKHIPIDAQWGRFRLASKVRLIGFTIPKNLDGLEVKEGKQIFLLDSNTFYIVFLDKDHQFYCTEKK